MNNITQQETLSTLVAMRYQEDSYTTFDMIDQADESVTCQRNPQHIDVECREKMGEWSLSVVKFCKFGTESVEIAMNYLDRFLATPAGQLALKDRSTYQLASMTCLYTAVKVHERQAMNPAVISQLSRGAYSEKQVEDMEVRILAALQWRMSPPTILSFCRQFLALVPSTSMSERIRATVYELCQLQVELAILDYKYISVNTSTIAFCAITNAFESLELDFKTTNHMSCMVTEVVRLQDTSLEIKCIQHSLYAAVHISSGEATTSALRQAGSTLDSAKQRVNRRASFEESPRAVSDRDIDL